MNMAQIQGMRQMASTMEPVDRKRNPARIVRVMADTPCAKCGKIIPDLVRGIAGDNGETFCCWDCAEGRS